MRYFRLLNDTPEAPAGTIFEEDAGSYRARGYACAMQRAVVEEQPEWFEEVEQIFVRAKNAERLQEIDMLADENTGIATPQFIQGSLKKFFTEEMERY